MVERSFSLDKALIFLFVGIIIASPLVLVISGVSIFEAVVFVAASFICCGVIVKDLYMVFLDILFYNKLDGKYGGSGKWKFSSISGDLAIFCIGLSSVSLFSFSFLNYSGVSCV